MLSTKLKEAAGNSADATLYVNDVFSTYLYTGTGAALTITNGIDLAGKGGLVWIKSRSAATDNKLTDTVRGATKALISNTTGGETTDTTGLTAFSSTGFSLGASSVYNTNAATYASWTFRKAAKFFDVVTYTGDGVAGRSIAHSLGVAPGCILVKNLSIASNWRVYHQSLGATKYMYLNTTSAAFIGTSAWNDTTPTSTVFTVGNDSDVNNSGDQFVAYLFAHDTSSTGIIQCGSFTTDASGSATVNLGWEPQYVMVKITSSPGGSWDIQDNMRGFTAKPTVYTANPILKANESSAENTIGANTLQLNSTGFTTDNATYNPSKTYIYMAIRMPNKPPTSGTQVYNAIARAGTSAVATVTGVGFPLDLSIIRGRAVGYSWRWGDRLRGVFQYLCSNLTYAEVTDNDVTSFNMDGITFPATGVSLTNAAGGNYINYFLKRAPGFFDVVCYTSNTTGAQNIAHNLGVAPELMIVKRRNAITNWVVYFGVPTKYVRLNTTDAAITLTDIWNDTAPTASVFTVGVSSDVNIQNGAGNYVAYLFATLAGISKVGSYTGNGTSQNINCGFAAGARFILIKCTSTTGDWYVWDSARGIVSANDPHLSLNTTAAEVTTDDSVDPYAAGFTVNQVAATNINVSSATYIFLAIA